MNLWVGKRWYLVKKTKQKKQTTNEQRQKKANKNKTKNPHFTAAHSLMGLRFYFYCLI